MIQRRDEWTDPAPKRQTRRRRRSLCRNICVAIASASALVGAVSAIALRKQASDNVMMAEDTSEQSWIGKRLEEIPSLAGQLDGSTLSYIGTMLEYDLMVADPSYANNASYMYNLITMENDCKWEYLQRYDYERCDYGANFAADNGMGFRFHALVYPEGGDPTFLTRMYDAGNLTNIERKRFLSTHIKETVSRYRGTATAFDVVNEAVCDFGYFCYPGNNCTEYLTETVTDAGVWQYDLTDCVYSDLYGTYVKSSLWYNGGGPGSQSGMETFVDESFIMAHKESSESLLCYNDYKHESMYGFSQNKSDAVYNMIVGMLDRGVPVNCVGFQTHIDISYVNKTRYVEGYRDNMQRYADLNLTVMITEFDAKCTDEHSDLPCSSWDGDKEAEQAELYGNIIQLCIEQPACNAFESWGYTDADSFADSDDEYGSRHPFPFDSFYRAKPAFGAMYRALVPLSSSSS